MRIGLPVSVFSHTALIAVGLMSLNFSEPYEPPFVESIAVEIVPITEFSNIRLGSLESEVIETQTPSLVDTPIPAELAERTGNTEEDQIKPIDSDNVTPAPTEQSAPEPVPEPDPIPEPEPLPEPEPQPEPEPEPVVEPTPEPEPAQPEPEPEPVVEPEPELIAPAPEPIEPAIAAPLPVVRTASVEQAREDYAKRQREEAAREADKVSEIINAEETRGGTTGTGGQATTGTSTGQSATLTRSEQDALAMQMRGCWRLLPGEIDSGESVRLLVELNRDGSVNGTPRVMTNITSPIQGSIARAAQRAVLGCGPYRLAPEKYANWRQVDVTFRPSDLS
ncbi:MAG: hypothetical protein L3J13_07255 [Devosiaceae bacterium]|nr:hypothetical protein [Devosiaceae bacterium]